MRTKLLMAFGITGVLAGCATTPAVPYWDNPKWVNALGKMVQDSIHYPKNASKENFPGGNAIVLFTYDNGHLRSPTILISTGSKLLDAAILEQISSISPPQAQGLNTETPHEFEMKVTVYPLEISLFRTIQEELQTHIQYPQRAIIVGATGVVVASFSYRNGSVFDAKIESSSDNRALDQAVLYELQTISFPKPPAWLKDKTFSLRVPVCFGLGQVVCPKAETRYVSTDTTIAPPKPPCVEIGYKYAHGKISNVHLIALSGDASFDKRALTAVNEGQIPHDSRSDSGIKHYNISVCNNSGLTNASATTNQH